MSAPEIEQLRTDVRQTVHKLNNLLTTVLVQADSILLTQPDPTVTRMVESILDSAIEAESVVKNCRAAVLEPAPEPGRAMPGLS